MAETISNLEELEKNLKSVVQQGIKVGCIENLDEVTFLSVKGHTFSLLKPNIPDEVLQISPFGHKSESKIDENIRRSKEVTLDVTTMDHRSLQYLQKLSFEIAFKEEKKHYVCVPYKIIKYTVDDHFKPHTDTPEKNLVKTLVLQLPTYELEGGDLTFNEVYKPVQNNRKQFLNYILFNIGVTHSVTKVTRGERFSITFKLFNVPELDKIRIETFSPNIEHINFKMGKDKFKNVLIIYKDLTALEEALQKQNIEYIEVYYDPDDKKPSYVYDNIISEEQTSEKWLEIKDILSGNEYKVDEWIDVGVCLDKMEYTNYYGYTGNEPIEQEQELSYAIGLLLNPVLQPNKKGIKGKINWITETDSDVTEIDSHSENCKRKINLITDTDSDSEPKPKKSKLDV